MANQPRNIQEELTQITDEFRIMHARVNGETHAQAARAEGKYYSQKLQRQALNRWGCETLSDYKPMHASALRAIMFQLRDHATTADPRSRWFEQIISAHEMCRLMHELAQPLPTTGEHKTGEPKKHEQPVSEALHHQEPSAPFFAVRRVWARVATP